MRGRVSRLARGVPAFESVWVDALAQARLLTPFQAAQINEDCASDLEVGPFALHERLASTGYTQVFRAREVATRRWARLTQFEVSADRAEDVGRQLDDLVRLGALLAKENIMPIASHGRSNGSIWAASRDQRGRTAMEWLIEDGRYPPDVVLEIARQMMKTLATCHASGLFHGGLGPGQVLLDELGTVWLTEPGLRVIVRPHEGFAQAEGPPEAFDYLPPERATSDISPDAAGDLYACGCLWWHLLAGRTPIPGGTGLMKLRAAQLTKIGDIRDLAPDVDAALAAVIDRLVDRDPNRRGESAAQVLTELGPSTCRARRRLARTLGRAEPRRTRAVLVANALHRTGSNGTVIATVAGAALALVVATWPMWGAKWLQAARRPSPDAPPSLLAQKSDEAEQLLSDPVAHAAGAVAHASYIAESDDAAHSGAGPSDAGPHVVLDTGQPLKLDTLALRPGQTVRGAAGQSAIVLVPYEGLTISAEDVRFENIDFVWDYAVAAATSDREAALLRLETLRTTFHGCSFQARTRLRRPLGTTAPAIVWHGPSISAAREFALPTGELKLTDCVLAGVSAAFACAGEGALMFQLSNVLHLGHGPLVELRRCRRNDEPMALSMSHVTLRGSDGLVVCRYDELEDEPGTLAIEASDCAFFPAPGAALIALDGAQRPGRVLEALQWTGQGSVVAVDAPLAVWRGVGGLVHEADESGVQVEGIVRTEVGFAGSADDGPAASRIVRWQVPLRSPEPPGIGDAPLRLPSLRRTRE
jgi:serine/threonine-protein kinase